jgi:Uma2 family endonuclease
MDFPSIQDEGSMADLRDLGSLWDPRKGPPRAGVFDSERCYDEQELMADSTRMAPTALLTAEDLWNLPDPDGLPHELVRGVLRLVMPPAPAHGSVSSRLLVALGLHVYPRGVGELFSESAFVLERNPDTVRCPDIAFVASGRLPAGGLGPRFLELAPDLAVEVVSPSDRRSAVMAKVADYLRLGVPCVWVVFPAERAVRICREGRPETLVGEHDVLAGGDVLPGFSCPVASLFSALRR